jgi:short-subunit dehydrogenase
MPQCGALGIERFRMNGKVALITGASSGLGAEYARLAARDGYDVVLVARRLPQMEALAAQLAPARAVAIAADLSRPGAAQELFNETERRGLRPDVLINNAGYGDAGAFLDRPLERESQMVDLNCRAVVELSWLYGRGMRDRRSGRILNVGSTAGFQPGPYMAAYYASKAFVISFSQGLAYELRGSGVTVTAHCPGATATEFSTTAGNDKSRLFQQQKPATAADVAAHGWRAMKAGKPVAVHGTLNKLGVFGARFSPTRVVSAIAARLNRPA